MIYFIKALTSARTDKKHKKANGRCSDQTSFRFFDRKILTSLKRCGSLDDRFTCALMYNYYIYIIVLVHDMIFSSYRFYLDMICDQDLAKRVRLLQSNLIADHLIPFIEDKTARMS